MMNNDDIHHHPMIILLLLLIIIIIIILLSFFQQTAPPLFTSLQPETPSFSQKHEAHHPLGRHLLHCSKLCGTSTCYWSTRSYLLMGKTCCRFELKRWGSLSFVRSEDFCIYLLSKGFWQEIVQKKGQMVGVIKGRLQNSIYNSLVMTGENMDMFSFVGLQQTTKELRQKISGIPWWRDAKWFGSKIELVLFCSKKIEAVFSEIWHQKLRPSDIKEQWWFYCAYSIPSQ